MNDDILSAENKETIRHALDANKREYRIHLDKFSQGDQSHPEVVGAIAKAERELKVRSTIPSSERAAFSKALVKAEQKFESWSSELNGIELGSANKLFLELRHQIGVYGSILQDLDQTPAKLSRLVEKLKSADHIAGWVPQELARADWGGLSSFFRAGTFDTEQIKRNEEAIADLEEVVRRAIVAGNFSRVAGGVKKRSEDDEGRARVIYPGTPFQR